MLEMQRRRIVPMSQSPGFFSGGQPGSWFASSHSSRITLLGKSVKMDVPPNVAGNSIPDRFRPCVVACDCGYITSFQKA